MSIHDLAPQEGGAAQDVSDPYEAEPHRHSALLVRSQKPFNAETPRVLLGEQLNTPNDLFYVRHHLPVPHIDPAEYRLSIEGAVPTILRYVFSKTRSDCATTCPCRRSSPETAFSQSKVR